MRKKIVVLTGAGISAESGISTFRDSDGLWENHRIEDVATPQAWHRDRALVLEFYNQRRAQLLQCVPNEAHKGLAKLEEQYDVTIITQNVDDLHERGGSTNIIHLHGELLKARSTADESLIYDWRKDIAEGDKCGKGSQLRPHIVWFGEAVPMIEKASLVMQSADMVIVVGTSLLVYPAAGLLHYAPAHAGKYIIDPKPVQAAGVAGIRHIMAPATKGVSTLLASLMKQQ
jgi:NAD-dependent deacetylase